MINESLFEKANKLANKIVSLTKLAIKEENPLYLMDLFVKVQEFREVLNKIEQLIAQRLFKNELIIELDSKKFSISDLYNYIDELKGEALKFYQFASYFLGNKEQREYAQNHRGEIEQRMIEFIPSLNALRGLGVEND